MNWSSVSLSSKEIVDASDLSVRVREISARIAALRSGLESNNQSNQATSSQPKSMVATTEQADGQESRQKDLNDLKAKLLGKKK